MKKISFGILIILPLLIFITPVYAYYGNTNSTIERTSVNNYKVNKKWNINTSNLDNVLKTPYVDASLKIYDYSDVLNNTEEQNLKNKIDSFISSHNMEMIIVTINLPYTDDKYNETVAADFYDYNDFGLDYEYYDGILLLRNTYANDPYYDIYTFGTAQLYFDNNRYNNILDSIYDDLHNGYYLDGFSNFIDICDSYINNGIPYSLKDSSIGSNNEIIYGNNYYSSGEAEGKTQISLPKKIFYASIITLIVYIIWLCINLKKCKMVAKATNANDYLVKESVKFSIKEDRFITSHITSYKMSSSSSGGGGGGHSSFGSSGGGHSSGGGRHG